MSLGLILSNRGHLRISSGHLVLLLHLVVPLELPGAVLEKGRGLSGGEKEENGDFEEVVGGNHEI